MLADMSSSLSLSVSGSMCEVEARGWVVKELESYLLKSLGTYTNSSAIRVSAG